jgi:phage baseplate assembly protein gpV
MDVGGIGGASRRIYGVVIGIVVDNHHPDGDHRVKVKFPWIRSTDVGDEEDFLSAWARISTLMAGPGRGFRILPEPDDEVLVMFEHGDLRRPIVMGSMWNGVDKAPVNGDAPDESTDPMGVNLGIQDACVDNSDVSKTNRGRFFTSRSGHLMLFDDSWQAGDEKIVFKTNRGHVLVLNDKRGSESVALYDSSGEEFLHFDEVNKKITLESRNGDIDILCKNGTLTIEAEKIVTKAGSTADHEAGSKMSQTAPEVTISGSSKVDIDGGMIELN